jgi:Kef-type K+ transport system membrane component KefB
MNTQEFVKLALQLSTMLGCAVLFGEIVRRYRQPAVIGEMFGGIVLGPTIFGWLAPSVYEWLFLSSANVTVVREAATKLGMLFFLFYAGLEVNLSDLKTLGRRAVLIGIIGTLLPIAAGVGLVYALPRAFWGPAVQEHFLSFALFIGMNLANSANPVIARILMELRLLDRPIGALIMSATIVDDLVNWTLFAMILGDLAPSSQAASGSLVFSALLVGLLFVVILGVGRWLGPPALRWVQPHVAWPSGYIAVTALLVLLASSASEALGVHAFLGAFLMGRHSEKPATATGTRTTSSASSSPASRRSSSSRWACRRTSSPRSIRSWWCWCWSSPASARSARSSPARRPPG